MSYIQPQIKAGYNEYLTIKNNPETGMDVAIGRQGRVAHHAIAHVGVHQVFLDRYDRLFGGFFSRFNRHPLPVILLAMPWYSTS